MVVDFLEYLTIGIIRTDESSTAFPINGLIVTVCCGIDVCGTSEMMMKAFEISLISCFIYQRCLIKEPRNFISNNELYCNWLLISKQTWAVAKTNKKYLHGGTPVCSSSTARAVVLAAILPHISEFVGCPSVQTVGLWRCDSRSYRRSNGASAYDKSQTMKHCTCINIMSISCNASDTYHSIYTS